MAPNPRSLFPLEARSFEEEVTCPSEPIAGGMHGLVDPDWITHIPGIVSE